MYYGLWCAALKSGWHLLIEVETTPEYSAALFPAHLVRRHHGMIEHSGFEGLGRRQQGVAHEGRMRAGRERDARRGKTQN
jgi:hypothetical protein